MKDITDTVCKIRMDADLSRRIDNIDTVRETKEKRSQKKRDERFISLRRRLTRCWMSWKPCLKERKQFTSDVSHELRTPISVMMAQVRSALKDEALKPKQKAQMKLIEQKAENMSDLIAQLLFYQEPIRGVSRSRKKTLI